LGKTHKIQYLQCPEDGDITSSVAEINCCRKLSVMRNVTSYCFNLQKCIGVKRTDTYSKMSST